MFFLEVIARYERAVYALFAAVGLVAFNCYAIYRLMQSGPTITVGDLQTLFFALLCDTLLSILAFCAIWQEYRAAAADLRGKKDA